MSEVYVVITICKEWPTKLHQLSWTKNTHYEVQELGPGKKIDAGNNDANELIWLCAVKVNFLANYFSVG